jgi:small subunit ribosomal protein S20
MANTESAEKRAAKSVEQRAANRAARARVRTLVKKARAALAAGEAASPAVADAVSGLDAAAGKGLIHRNAAARTKSRLARAAKQSAAR